MNEVEVLILTRKDKPGEAMKVDQIQRVITQAAKIINKQVRIEVTNNFKSVANLSVSVALTPIVVINGATAFAKDVPNLEKVKTHLINSGSGELF